MQRDDDQPNAREKLIKTVFYNGLINYIIGEGDFHFTRESLPEQLQSGIAYIISAILANSQDCNGLRPPELNMVITQALCPNKYLPLFGMLMKLKSQSPSPQQLSEVARQIMAFPSFNELNPTQYLLEMAGLEEPALHAIHYDEANITPALIRETFYNEMVTQAFLAIEHEWLSLSDLENEEPKIYLALPSLTILEAIQQSQQCDGIRLLNGKALNSRNCPQTENFPELIDLLLRVKATIMRLSDNELQVVKHILSCDKDLPVNIAHLKTPELMKTVGVINNMAIEISRRRVFHETIQSVLTVCCDSFSANANNLSPRP